MKRKIVLPIAMVLILLTILYVPNLLLSQGVQPGASEPQDLEDLVEYPEEVLLTDVLDEKERGSELARIIVGVEGFTDILNFLKEKGYQFENSAVRISNVGGAFHGSLLSWWSEASSKGTRALIVAALMDDGSDMVMGAVTNLLPPEMIPELDPFIIVNAQPYLFISWYWWVPAPVSRIHSWYYWWYDSHSHPNWFWGVYWWWRTDVGYYYLAPYGRQYLPWWWFFWHWTYWRHWYWWSTYFPYKR